MRDTPYAREIATADLAGNRIERLYVKSQDQEEIRFSRWKDGNMANRPLDLPEEELLPLLELAMSEGVFTDKFLSDLQTALDGHRKTEEN